MDPIAKVIQKLLFQVKSVAPVDGVAIGLLADKGTWRIDFQPQATAQERTAAEAVRDAFDAAAVLIFEGLGRVQAEQASFVTTNNTGVAVEFGTEVFDFGGYHSNVTNPDRFTIPEGEGGVYRILAGFRFLESSAAAGGTANAGDRLGQIRLGANTPLATVRAPASASSNTEFQVIDEAVLAAGDVIRAVVLQNCGGTMNVAARMTLRRLE